VQGGLDGSPLTEFSRGGLSSKGKRPLRRTLKARKLVDIKAGEAQDEYTVNTQRNDFDISAVV